MDVLFIIIHYNIFIAKYAKIYLVVDNENKSESGGNSGNSGSLRSTSLRGNISGGYKLVPNHTARLSNIRSSRARNQSTLGDKLDRADKSVRMDCDGNNPVHYPLSPISPIPHTPSE